MTTNTCPFCGGEIRRYAIKQTNLNDKGFEHSEELFHCVDCEKKFIKCRACKGEGFINGNDQTIEDYLDCDECSGTGYQELPIE